METNKKIKKNIAATLNDEMKRRKMSYEVFAKFLHIGKTSLQNYLSGDGNPALDTLLLIVEKLDISLEEILFRKRTVKSPGRIFLNAVSDEISTLHPSVREGAQRQLHSLEALYDLSDYLLADESLKEILSTQHTL